jgi:hypothetical protein
MKNYLVGKEKYLPKIEHDLNIGKELTIKMNFQYN